ncbi:hypothetical protein Thermus77420_24330 [Thermus thalpophilus]
MGAVTFRSKKAEAVYKIICSLPPLTDEQVKAMVEAIAKVTGRRHPVRPIRGEREAPKADPSGLA